MTDPKPTISDLVQNTRTHVEAVRDKAVATGELAGPLLIALETIDTDLDLIERALSDVLCDLQSHIDRLM